MSASNQKMLLTVEDWDVSAVKYFPPKPSNGGGKNIKFISSQLGKGLYLNLPKMIQYGIADYVNKDTGVHDGKFKMSCKVSSPELVQKLNAFKEQLIDDAVKNSQAWFGGSKPISREIAEYNLKFALDYPKVSQTDKTADTSKDPYFKLSIPYYRDSGWDLQVFDPSRRRLFPSEDYDSPIDLVPKGATVNLFIQCNTIWVVDGKWGPTFKVVQCMVYPQDNTNFRDSCMIPGSDDYQNFNPSVPTPLPAPVLVPTPVGATTKPQPVSTTIDDEDEDDVPVQVSVPAPVVPAPVPVQATPEPVVEEEAAAPVKKTVRKIVKK